MQSEFIGMKFDLNNSLSMLKLALAHKIHNFQALSFPNNPKRDSNAEFMIMEIVLFLILIRSVPIPINPRLCVENRKLKIVRSKY